MCNLHCGACGHSADLGEFCRTTMGGELPSGHYQCPACSIAWQVKHGPITTYLDHTGVKRFYSEPSKIIFQQAHL